MTLDELFEAKKRGPQWLIGDLANRFGLTLAQLTGARKKFPGFPEPSLKHAAHTTTSNRVYYDLKDAVQWYQDVLDKVNGDIEQLKKQVK